MNLLVVIIIFCQKAVGEVRNNFTFHCYVVSYLTCGAYNLF